MIYYYCSKCGGQNNTAQCTHCGKKLPAGSMRNVWNVARVPAGDPLVWKTVLCFLFSLVGVLFLLALFCNLIMKGNVDAALEALPAILAVLPLGAVGALVVLLLQGREEVWYIMQADGVRVQTWHRPSRLHSWARLQSYREGAACPQPDGSLLTPAGEVTLAWRDIAVKRCSPQTGRIYLFRTPHVTPLILRLPADEYNMAEAMVNKYAKGARK